MRTGERWRYLARAPLLLCNILGLGHHDFQYDLMPVHFRGMPPHRRLNLLRSGGNLLHRRLQPWSWPINMHVELTNYCNLKCEVCPTGSRTLNRPPTSLEPALLERLLDEVAPYLMTASLWGWGESLLHPQLADILRITHNRGMTTFLSTNGQNLDDEKVQQALLDYPPTYLIVALDGITDETNSVFRVGARLNPALEGVRRLRELKEQHNLKLPVLHMRYIVMKHNEHELPQLPGFAAENGFEMLTIRTLSIIDAPDDRHRNLLPEDASYQAYGYKDGKRIVRSDFLCEKAFTFPALFADGTIVACDQDCNAQQPYGSLADGGSFADIWWGERAAAVRRTIREDAAAFSFCRNCPFKDRPVSTCSTEYHDLSHLCSTRPIRKVT